MKGGTTLASLRLQIGVLDIETLRTSAEALEHNHMLQTLTLHCRADMSDANGAAFAEALKHNRTLQTFSPDCCDTNMGDASGATFAGALEHNRNQ